VTRQVPGISLASRRLSYLSLFGVDTPR